MPTLGKVAILVRGEVAVPTNTWLTSMPGTCTWKMLLRLRLGVSRGAIFFANSMHAWEDTDRF